MRPVSALITDMRKQWARVTAKALAKRQIAVTAVGRDSLDFGGRSNRLARRLLVRRGADSSSVGRVYVEAMRGLDVMLPMSEETAVFASSHRGELKDPLVPESSALEIALDKARSTKLASSLKMPTPRTACPGGAPDLHEATAGLTYPVAVKYRLESGVTDPHYARVGSPGQLAEVYGRMAASQSRPLVQEWVTGTGYGFSAVFDANSEPVLAFMQKDIHEYPAAGGFTTYCESVFDPELLRLGLRLLKRLRWRGPAHVDFVKDEASGEFKFLEVNPRLYGSLALAIRSGADFPYILYRAARKEEALARDFDGRGYEVGVKCRFPPDFILAPVWLSAPKRGVSRREYLTSFFDAHVHHEGFDPDDFSRYVRNTLRGRDALMGRDGSGKTPERAVSKPSPK